MNNYTQNETLNFAENLQKKENEKRNLKKVSNLIGTVFLILWLLPGIINEIITDTAKALRADAALGVLFSDPAVLMVYQTVLSILLFTLPFLILPLGTGRRITEVAAIKKPNKALFVPFLLIGAGVSAFANIITGNITAFFEGFGIQITSPNIEYPNGIFGFMLSFVAIAITPALVEEFATRGMVMGCARKYGEVFGLIISSTFFALMHGNLVQIPFAFIMGFTIGFAVIKTGSLVTGMAIHFVNNAIAVTMGYTEEIVQSVILQALISFVYIGVCSVILFVGIYLAQKRDEKVWSLEKSESALSLGERLKYFFFAPTMIISVGVTVIDCISMISLG